MSETSMLDVATLWRSRHPRRIHVERMQPARKGADRVIEELLAPWSRTRVRRVGDLDLFVASVSDCGVEFEGCTLAELRSAADRLKTELRQAAPGGSADPLARAFALVRACASSILGVRHYDVQVRGAAVLLAGQVAEMETGEGKTLTATLAASAAALAGLPVHVVTVNDYLARRDAETLRPLYASLGLTTGCVVGGMSAPERRSAYGCDIVYCTGKEVTFDYLRDRSSPAGRGHRLTRKLREYLGTAAAPGLLLQRGLCFGIVDEADSVLIDEARTPLILSRSHEGGDDLDFHQAAVGLARELEVGRDFVMLDNGRRVELTLEGRERIETLALPLGGLWSGARRSQAFVVQALTAIHALHCDRDYVIRDERVQIVDEFTGRVMPDRAWEAGLHQCVEVKEGLAPSSRQEPIARTTFPDFFARYLRLAGMTGTASEVASEFWATYRLGVVRIPPHRESRRENLGGVIHDTRARQLDAIVARVTRLVADGRPVLIGTRSVQSSETLSAALSAAGIEHRVLNARQDGDEAAIVARAGERASVTVATNMAGRGTDIPLGGGVAERGGLHVILTEGHDARRVDRQLAGRCGRQGDPGSFEYILSLEDDLFVQSGAGARAVLVLSRAARPLRQQLLARALDRAQRSRERAHARERRALRRSQEQLDRTLAFAGDAE